MIVTIIITIGIIIIIIVCIIVWLFICSFELICLLDIIYVSICIRIDKFNFITLFCINQRTLKTKILNIVKFNLMHCYYILMNFTIFLYNLFILFRLSLFFVHTIIFIFIHLHWSTWLNRIRSTIFTGVNLFKFWSTELVNWYSCFNIFCWLWMRYCVRLGCWIWMWDICYVY